MRKTAVCLILLAVTSSAVLRTQPATESRNVLIVADDLHLEFRITPCVRELIKRTLRGLAPDSGLLSLISTGSSAINIPPTSDLDSVSLAVSRVLGSGLPPETVLTARRQPDVAAELRNRATDAFSLVANGIDAMASASHNPIAVLYFSEGYLDGDTPQPTELIRSALRADASIYTIDPRGLTGVQAPVYVKREQWDAFIAATQDSLRTLATQTRGATVTVQGLNTLVARLAHTGADTRATPTARDERQIDLPCHSHL